MENRISIKDLNYSYGDSQVLDSISMDIMKDSIVCLLGKSGCGKSTLLNIFSGIEKNKGRSDLSFGKVSYSFQEDRLLENLTVYDNIKFANKNKSTSEIIKVIKLVMLEGYENYYPKELSGGMRKRVSLARAFINDSDLMLLDEPFSSLDVTLISDIIQAINEIFNDRKRTIVIVTHRVDVALLLADKIYILNGSPAKVTSSISIEVNRSSRNLSDTFFSNLIEKIENDLGEK